MREIGKKVIGESTYSVSDWSPSKALKWQRRIIPRLARAAALASGSLKGGLGDLNGPALACAVDAMFDGLGEDDYVLWAKELVEGCLVDGRSLSIDSDFHGGKILDLNVLMVFVIQHQFRDFFQGANGLLGRAADLLKSKGLTAAK